MSGRTSRKLQRDLAVQRQVGAVIDGLCALRGRGCGGGVARAVCEFAAGHGRFLTALAAVSPASASAAAALFAAAGLAAAACLTERTGVLTRGRDDDAAVRALAVDSLVTPSIAPMAEWMMRRSYGFIGSNAWLRPVRATFAPMRRASAVRFSSRLER